MSLIAQPLVRAYTFYSDTWPEEDVETFESFFTIESLEYVPQNADPAKGNLQLYYRNIRQFIPFWFKNRPAPSRLLSGRHARQHDGNVVP